MEDRTDLEIQKFVRSLDDPTKWGIILLNHDGTKIEAGGGEGGGNDILRSSKKQSSEDFAIDDTSIDLTSLGINTGVLYWFQLNGLTLAAADYTYSSDTFTFTGTTKFKEGDILDIFYSV